MKKAKSYHNALLEIKDLAKSFTTSSVEVNVLEDINLTINKGEFVCILGPSGCGKTTLLRLIAGLEAQTKGAVLIKGKSVNGPSHESALVFQEPRLFPWLTVKENIAFGLRGRVEKDHCSRLVNEYVELMSLKSFSKAYPHELSGGMAQRVAIARALVVHPEILLLDEPFSSLDAVIKRRLQDEVLRLWETTGKTMIMVTHDIEEAIRLGQRLVIMSAAPGRIIQEFRMNNKDNEIEISKEKIEEIKTQVLECLSSF